MDCTWRIRNERGRRLWVRFRDFDTEWQRDFLSLGNGPEPDEGWTTVIIDYHSGWLLPNPQEFISTSDEVIYGLYFHYDFLKFLRKMSLSREEIKVRLA